jgi:hypothetical protein
MRSWGIGLLALFVGLAAGIGFVKVFWTNELPEKNSTVASLAQVERPTKGKLRLVCDLELDKGKDVLGINPSDTKRIAMIGFDFDRESGWYDGVLAISESRPGTLTIDGDVLRVNRPAIFQRFGANIAGESFTVDRVTGNFQQHIKIDTGFEIPLIRGHCARLVNPPF